MYQQWCVSIKWCGVEFRSHLLDGTGRYLHSWVPEAGKFQVLMLSAWKVIVHNKGTSRYWLTAAQRELDYRSSLRRRTLDAFAQLADSVIMALSASARAMTWNAHTDAHQLHLEWGWLPYHRLRKPVHGDVTSFCKDFLTAANNYTGCNVEFGLYLLMTIYPITQAIHYSPSLLAVLVVLPDPLIHN